MQKPNYSEAKQPQVSNTLVIFCFYRLHITSFSTDEYSFDFVMANRITVPQSTEAILTDMSSEFDWVVVGRLMGKNVGNCNGHACWQSRSPLHPNDPGFVTQEGDRCRLIEICTVCGSSLLIWRVRFEQFWVGHWHNHLNVKHSFHLLRLSFQRSIAYTWNA